VVYQIYPRSFVDSDGNGVGDLRGIISKLDYLRWLGVDAIWISPFYPSPGADMGYDISDYTDVDPLFGDLQAFDDLVAAAHTRGLRVIVDIVANHTSDEHAWFVESRSAKTNAKRDWYWWRPARAGYQPGTPGAEPNNWASFFGGSAWSFDPETGEYYLHLFDRKQPDLNWENPEVRQALFEMMRWWKNRGVDGLRLDVINLVSKVPTLPGDDSGNGFKYYACGPRIHKYMAELRAGVAGSDTDFVLIGETPGVNPEQAVGFTDQQRGELDMIFAFQHVELGQENGKFDTRALLPGELADMLAYWQESLGDAGWIGLYLSNHDQPRQVSRFGDDSEQWRAHSAKTLALASMLQRGTAFVYQGEEIGMINANFASASELRDVESLNYLAQGGNLKGVQAAGRDNARTPMQWDSSPGAGFTAGTPWVAVPARGAHISVAEQRAAADSVLNFYRALVELRHREPAIGSGSYRRVATDTPAVYAYERELGEQRLRIIANLSDETAHTTLSDCESWQELLATEPIAKQNPLVLPPWSGVVLQRS
jgi:oligo-1,6-glucosidase